MGEWCVGGGCMVWWFFCLGVMVGEWCCVMWLLCCWWINGN